MRRALASAGILAGLLVACTSTPTPGTTTSPPATAAATPDDRPAQPSPTAPPAPAPTAERCDADRREQVVTTVDLQLDAIARGEWERAWGYASPDFRAGIDVERFREIITSGFPVVADNRARDIGRCRTTVDEATLEVTVEDGDGTRRALLYLLRRTPDGWSIGGATPVGDDAGPPQEPTVTA
jgi:hypothetical protein